MSRRKQAKPRALKREALQSEDESTEDTLPLGDNNFVQEIQNSPTPVLEASSVDSADEDASSTDMDDDPKYRCGSCRASFDDLNDFLEHHEDCITRGSNGAGTATPPGSLRSLSGTPDEATLSPSPGSSSCCATPSSSSGGGGTGCDPDSELSFTLGVTESTPYGCQFCDRAFPRLSYLKRHEQVHSDQMPFRCDYCQRLFKHKRSRDRHVKLHTGDRKYRCTQCESAFSRSDHLKIHMKTHDNGKPYQCTVCNRGYNTAAALSSHMQNHKKTPQQELLVQPNFDPQHMTVSSEVSSTPLPPSSTKCGQCSAEFNNVADLQSHLTHQHCRNISESPEPPKPLICSFCPQVYTSPESLKVHVTQNHQGSCPSPVSSTNNTKYSEDGFSPGVISSYKTERSSPSDNYQNLQDIQQPSRTERFSPGQQQLTCGFCSRCDFPSFESLQLHVQVLHTSQCNSTSSNPSRNLIKQRPPKHMSPTGSAGFNCEFCCQSFSSLPSLQKHTLTTHSFGEILAQQKKSADIYCSQCNIGFTSSNALLEHVHLVHEPNTTSHSLSLNNNKRNLVGSRLRPNGVKHMKTSPILSNPPMSLFNGMSSAFYRRQNIVRSESPISSTVGGHTLTPPKALSNTLLCNQCNAAFQDFESFRTHLKNHLDEAAGLGSHTSHRFACPECDVEFDNDHLLDGHVIGHFLSSTIEYGCQSCLKLFQKPDDLQKHLLDIHAHHLYRCALCKQVFDSKVSIQVHFAVKHSNECRTFKCISCGAYFRNELEFQIHVKVSHLSCPENSKSCQPFRCLLCDQVCPSEEQLRYHVATHKKPFPCSLCGEAFHVEFLLDRHVQTVHQNTGRLTSSSPIHHPFLSGQSKSATTPNSELVGNSTTPDDVAQNLSVKRNMPNFSSKSGERNNPSVGTPEIVVPRMSTPSPTSTSGTAAGVTTTTVPSGATNLEFRCDVCDVCSFPTEAALNSHRRQAHNVRSGQKGTSGTQPPALSLFCAYCNESCKSRHDLENHMKGHTATPTRHKCNICDEVCPSAATLAEHKLTHCKVVSSSTCIVCRIPLTTEEDFVSHLQQHNNGAKSEHGLPGPCVVCRQTLIAEVEMRMHAKFHARNCANPEVATHGSCCVCSRKFDIGNLIIRSLAKPSSSDVLPHTYMCKECFHSKSDEVPAATMRCGDCGVKFENECEMDIHRRKCGNQFNHIRTDDINGKTYQCIKCQTSFESEAEIQAHVTCHVMQEGTDHECRLCQKVLDSPSKLQCHLIEHTFEGCPSFTCYMCSSVFTGSHLLQQHMLEHGLDARPYDCSRCHHKFYFRAELDNHSFIHQMEDHAKSLAKDCFKELRQFCSPTLSLQDVQEVFSDRDAFFHCRKCSAKFATFSDLQHHTCLVRLKELNSVKKECETLNDNFRSKQAADTKFEFTVNQQCEPLISEKKHGCPMCQKRFTRRENLRLHLKTRHQSEDTPYSCTQCGKAFSRKGLLKEHGRIHSESSTRPCENCNQSFESAQLLRHHQAISHGRHFDHKCPVCGDLFSKEKSLEAHLDKAHQVRVQEPEQPLLEKIQSPELSEPDTQKQQGTDDSQKNDDDDLSASVVHDESDTGTLDSQNQQSGDNKKASEISA